MPQGRYNQVANFVLTQSEINIAIGDKAPAEYFCELAELCNSGPKKYGGIDEAVSLRANLATNCAPGWMLDEALPEYDDILEDRRKLMA